MQNDPRAQNLPLRFCNAHAVPVAMTDRPRMLYGRGVPRLVHDYTCPECDAMLKGVA